MTKYTFRAIAWLEGISFLLLLGVAMPLKYYWNKPEAVEVIGMIHGLLFVSYLIFLYMIKQKYQWSNYKILVLGLMSVVPFGMLWIDSHVK